MFLINLSSAPYTNIFEQINHINFPNLQMLCLSDSKITTIEPICKLNTPLLDYLNLCNQKINYIRK